MSGISVTRGFAEEERAVMAELYLEAFGDKLGRLLGRGARARRFLAASLDPDFALVARLDGTALGLAGFRCEGGGLTDGFARELPRHYGPFGGWWRGSVLAALESREPSDKLYVDGIAVAEAARGCGLGRRLLDALAQEAGKRGKRAVVLDVIDSNIRARALYEREGYRVSGRHDLGPLRHVFGFRRAVQMRRDL
ncbi:GNAT family N-acetyltransferase [Roseobacter sp. HKCCA0434]|uniref:GNAT family N-acetyltransferase n=1 Tax=Roseobacter sp. HKCCA0434 TaxID=3079297 RepID=UPI0029059A20|nr:GNAT family N-acetyltransferase [Roseobacter sp. HKCCA0434]